MVKLTADLVYGFAAGLLSKGFDAPAPTPACHLEWWELCCSDYPWVSIAAPRGHAKSTAITKSYTLANALFRVNDYILIISDTYAQACLFLGELKRELLQNTDLIDIFEIQKDEKTGTPLLEMDRENDVIVTFKDGYQFRITALGSEQKVRGMLWKGKRPNLVVGDDLENDEIVMNKERRDKFSNWIYQALLPCLSERGKVRLVGTILHMASFLESTMPKDKNENSIHTDLSVRTLKPVDGWMSIRYAAHGPDGKFDKLLWPVMWTEDRLRRLKEIYTAKGNPEGYYQEYLNRPIDPTHSFFRKEDFQEISDDVLKSPWDQYPCYLSVDLATSTKERRDWSVFGIGSTDATGRLYIRKIVRDRLDSKEIVDTIIRLKQQYQFNIILIGKGTLEKSIGPFLREALRLNNDFCHLEAIPEVVDKRMRATSIRGRMRAGGVYFDKRGAWYPEFESEMLQFDRGQHDDQVDMMSLYGMHLDTLQMARSPKEIEDDLWEEENRTSLEQTLNNGRSITTGY